MLNRIRRPLGSIAWIVTLLVGCLGAIIHEEWHWLPLALYVVDLARNLTELGRHVAPATKLVRKHRGQRRR